MTPLDRGFLLLCSHLGNPERKPLTTAQLRTLADRAVWSGGKRETRELSAGDLQRLGYSRPAAEHMVALLEEEALLDRYLQKAGSMVPITRADPRYPLLLRQRLGLDSPGCLWAKGDLSILNTPAISLVGSRDLSEPNREFARAVGYEAAVQGLTLVSGNARGADRAAQDACLQAGGRVISLVADELSTKTEQRNLLYLSQEDYDAPFSAQRALNRNPGIHCLGRMVFVAQCCAGQGGTWAGTTRNLQFGWSQVACFDDGSQGTRELEAMGAYAVKQEDLKDLADLKSASLI